MADPRPIVIALTYYAPYVSGLTEVARQVAEGLAAEGRRVVVVTSRHDPALPAREIIGGVEVRRSRVLLRIGKGVIAPGFPFAVARAARGAAVVNTHLPMLEAGLVGLLVRRPVVPTYHCDVELPRAGWFGRLQRRVMDVSNRLAIRRAAATIVSTHDYAEHSRLSADLGRTRTVEIAPTTRDRSGGSPSFRDGAGCHVGFMGRLVEEKGIPTLIAAFRAIDDPTARLLIAGDFAGVAGGSVIDDVRAGIGADPRIRVLGFLEDAEIPDFFASLDAFALPSLNALEAFGIVQVEAMRAGVPVVASDLPGVRQPVRRVGLGEIARVGDRDDLRDRLLALRDVTPARRREAARRATELYAAEVAVAAYARLFDEVADPDGSARFEG